MLYRAGHFCADPCILLSLQCVTLCKMQSSSVSHCAECNPPVCRTAQNAILQCVTLRRMQSSSVSRCAECNHSVCRTAQNAFIQCLTLRIIQSSSVSHCEECNPPVCCTAQNAIIQCIAPPMQLIYNVFVEKYAAQTFVCLTSQDRREFPWRRKAKIHMFPN